LTIIGVYLGLLTIALDNHACALALDNHACALAWGIYAGFQKWKVTVKVSPPSKFESDKLVSMSLWHLLQVPTLN
jgi:hypothetical protein